MFVRTRKHKKKQKNIFFNYFLIYLIAIIVIIALNTKNINKKKAYLGYFKKKFSSG
jgi:hypothetical protein